MFKNNNILKILYNILGMSDIVISSSRQEGLPVNLIEAMAAGKPIVATRCRGNIDLIKDGINGVLVDIGDEKQMAQAVIQIAGNKILLDFMGDENIKDVRKYSNEIVNKQMHRIYLSLQPELMNILIWGFY